MVFALATSALLALSAGSLRQRLASEASRLFKSAAQKQRGRKLFYATYDCTWDWGNNQCNPSPALISNAFGSAGESINAASRACSAHSSEDKCTAPCDWNKSQCDLGGEFILDTVFDMNLDSCGDVGKYLTKNFACDIAFSTSGTCDGTCKQHTDKDYNADTQTCEEKQSCSTSEFPASTELITDDPKCKFIESLQACGAISDTSKCGETDSKCLVETSCSGSTPSKSCGYSFGITTLEVFLRAEFQSSWASFSARASKCDTKQSHDTCESGDTLFSSSSQVGISLGIATSFAVMVLSML